MVWCGVVCCEIFSSVFVIVIVALSPCRGFYERKNRKKIITVFLFCIIVKKGTSERASGKQGHFLPFCTRIHKHSTQAGQIKSFEFLAHNLLLLCGCFFCTAPVLKQWDDHFSLVVSYSKMFFFLRFFRFLLC